MAVFFSGATLFCILAVGSIISFCLAFDPKSPLNQRKKWETEPDEEADERICTRTID